MKSAPAPTRWWRSPPPDRSGLKVEDVTVMLGDSSLPPVTVAGGSNNAATTAQRGPYKACEEGREAASPRRPTLDRRTARFTAPTRRR